MVEKIGPTVMKGQDVLPILELEIETDSILDASTGLAI